MSHSVKKGDSHGTKTKIQGSFDRRGSGMAPNTHIQSLFDRRGSEMIPSSRDVPSKYDGTRRDSGIGGFLSSFSTEFAGGPNALHVGEKGSKLQLEAPALHTLAMLSRPHPLHVSVVTGFLSLMGYGEQVLLVCIETLIEYSVILYSINL